MDAITLEELAAFPGRLERHFCAVPRSHWSWNPPSWDEVPSERLNALEQLCHVRDIEIDGYHERLRRLIETRLARARVARCLRTGARAALRRCRSGASARADPHGPRADADHRRSSERCTARAHGSLRRLRPAHGTWARALSLQPRPATPRARTDREFAQFRRKLAVTRDPWTSR
jgi:hypothetical protein